MNLKHVAAAMSILGLVSCPVLAATDMDASTSSTTSTTTSTTTTKKHHRHKHHKVKHEAAEGKEDRDYKDMGTLPAKDEPACIISQATVVYDAMGQNLGRAMPNPCNPGWFNRISLTGGAYVSTVWGNRNADYMGENYKRFSLNDVYVNIAANINDWTKAFVSISYMDATTFESGFAYKGFALAEYDAAYSSNALFGAESKLQLEQGFMTFANFDQSPFFLQIGKQFQDFSRYEIHPITLSMTQVLSEVLATSAKLGFITPMGFNGSIYAFDDPIPKVGQNSTPTNYGIALGYDMPGDALGFDVGAAYLYNMIGANSVAYMVATNNVFTTGFPGYNNRVGAVAVYADVNSGPFSVGARWTGAVQRFSPLDLPKNGVAGYTGGILNPLGTFVIPGSTGAKPWAAGIQAAFGFEAWDRPQNVYVGYQASGEAAGLQLPKQRWLAGYGIDLFGRNTNIAVEWDHDIAYSVANGGTNKNTNIVTLQAGVKFG